MNWMPTSNLASAGGTRSIDDTVIGVRGTPYSCPDVSAVDHHIVRLYKRIEHAAPCAAEQEFSKGHKVIEPSQVQAWAEKVCRQPAIRLRSRKVPCVRIRSNFGCKADNTACIISKASRAALIAKVIEGITRVEIDVTVPG